MYSIVCYECYGCVNWAEDNVEVSKDANYCHKKIFPIHIKKYLYLCTRKEKWLRSLTE